MSQIVRWGSAALVTAAAFSLSAWICGALLLPPLVTSAADRWALAAGAGTAVAALAALWGASWAKPESPGEPAETTQPGGAGTAVSGNGVAVRGDNDGIIATGKNAKNTQIR